MGKFLIKSYEIIKVTVVFIPKAQRIAKYRSVS